MNTDMNTNSIHEAAKLGDLKELKRWISSGVPCNEIDENGSTPLHITAFYNHKIASTFLIKSGANINALDNTGLTALQKAILRSSLDSSKILILSGADVFQTGKFCYSPIALALQLEYIDLVNLMHKKSGSHLSILVWIRKTKTSPIFKILVEEFKLNNGVALGLCWQFSDNRILSNLVVTRRRALMNRQHNLDTNITSFSLIAIEADFANSRRSTRG